MLTFVRSTDPQCMRALLGSGVLMPIIRSPDPSVSGALRGLQDPEFGDLRDVIQQPSPDAHCWRSGSLGSMLAICVGCHGQSWLDGLLMLVGSRSAWITDDPGLLSVGVCYSARDGDAITMLDEVGFNPSGFGSLIVRHGLLLDGLGTLIGRSLHLAGENGGRWHLSEEDGVPYNGTPAGYGNLVHAQ
ncbi:hypothetical protein ACLOJK_028454 [Asimina triloba]